MVECGYTWEYIDREMDLIKLNALIERWKIVPPLSVSVAAIAHVLGVEQRTGGEQDEAAKLAQAKQEARMLNTGAR